MTSNGRKETRFLTHKLHQNEDERTSNVMSAFSWSYVYKDFFFFLNTLSGGKSGSVAPGVAVPPWATETVLSPWMAADEARVSHVLPHVVRWKKKNIYIYIYA